ncbi:type III effector, partial [Pseudomonas syringae pv. tagetis]
MKDHVFAAHKLPLTESAGDQSAIHAHNAQNDALIDARARRLSNEGDTRAPIAETFAKPEKLDRMATL